MRRTGANRRGRTRQAAMKPLEFHRRFVLHVELLQALRAARVDVTRKFPVGMQHGYTAPVSLLERLQVAVVTHPQLSIQLEKIDLVCHALSPVHGDVPHTPSHPGGPTGQC